jgi:ribose 1,5-bisphosphokinase
MMAGRLIAVVGPSGVGKDSVMAGLKAARPGLTIARRVITRSADLGGEDFDPVSEAAFVQARDRGAFALHWGAHGLFYGIPLTVQSDLDAGQDVLVNLSRGVLPLAQRRFAGVIVLQLTASPAVLAERLAGRGRETADQIVARLGRSVDPLPAGLNVVTVSNDGPLAQTITQAVRALYPDRG